MNIRELERRNRTHPNQYRYASEGDTRFHTCTFTVYLAAVCNKIPTAVHDLFSDPTFQFNILQMPLANPRLWDHWRYNLMSPGSGARLNLSVSGTLAKRGTLISDRPLPQDVRKWHNSQSLCWSHTHRCPQWSNRRDVIGIRRQTMICCSGKKQATIPIIRAIVYAAAIMQVWRTLTRWQHGNMVTDVTWTMRQSLKAYNNTKCVWEHVTKLKIGMRLSEKA